MIIIGVLVIMSGTEFTFGEEDKKEDKKKKYGMNKK
jgi:uncharacterized membrane protein